MLSPYRFHHHRNIKVRNMIAYKNVLFSEYHAFLHKYFYASFQLEKKMHLPKTGISYIIYFRLLFRQTKSYI